MNVKVIKAKDIPRQQFDEILARTEAKNAEAVFTLHLQRCDRVDAAGEIASVFLNLGKRFEHKKVALLAKVS